MNKSSNPLITLLRRSVKLVLHNSALSKVVMSTISCLAILTACATHPIPPTVYPGAWPDLKPVKKNVCPKIAGTYVDNGVSYYKQQGVFQQAFI